MSPGLGGVNTQAGASATSQAVDSFEGAALRGFLEYAHWSVTPFAQPAETLGLPSTSSVRRTDAWGLSEAAWSLSCRWVMGNLQRWLVPIGDMAVGTQEADGQEAEPGPCGQGV